MEALAFLETGLVSLAAAVAYFLAAAAILLSLVLEGSRGAAHAERPRFRLLAWTFAVVFAYGIHLFLAAPAAEATDPRPSAAALAVVACSAFAVLYALPFALAKLTRVGIGEEPPRRQLPLTAWLTRRRPRAFYAIWGPGSLVMTSLLVLAILYVPHGARALVPALALAAVYAGTIRLGRKAAATSVPEDAPLNEKN